MLIQVTEEDIKNGVRMHPCMCPVALALKRQAPPNTDVGVARHHFHFRNLINDNVISYINSPEMVEFIKAFDTGKEVKPISFELRI